MDSQARRVDLQAHWVDLQAHRVDREATATAAAEELHQAAGTTPCY